MLDVETGLLLRLLKVVMTGILLVLMDVTRLAKLRQVFIVQHIILLAIQFAEIQLKLLMKTVITISPI